MANSANINEVESTLVQLRVVQGSNFNNTVHSLDGNTGEANIGGQWVNGRQKVNSANNVTIFDANSGQGYIKFVDLAGKTIAVIDCRPETAGFYVAGKIHDGHTPESLDNLFPTK